MSKEEEGPKCALGCGRDAIGWGMFKDLCRVCLNAPSARPTMADTYIAADYTVLEARVAGMEPVRCPGCGEERWHKCDNAHCPTNEEVRE